MWSGLQSNPCLRVTMRKATIWRIAVTHLNRRNRLSEQIPFLDFGGEGPELHFAHANAYTPGAYWPFLSHLTDNFHVLGLKQRPLWPGQPPRQLNDWSLFADDLIAFLDQQALQGVIGVGHSLGAVATMMAAVRRPELFRVLVLIEPVFLAPAVLEMARQYPEQAFEIPLVRIARKRRDRWPTRAEAFAHFRQKKVFSRLSDEALWSYVNHALCDDADGQVTLCFPAIWEAQIYGTPPTDVWQLLPQLSQPTLAMRATETDTLLSPAWTLWQEIQPDATFVEVPSAGHLLPLEYPAATAEKIYGFLQKMGMQVE
jgi:pimeloyl-ACP methyl ester carboxylesterase